MCDVSITKTNALKCTITRPFQKKNYEKGSQLPLQTISPLGMVAPSPCLNPSPPIPTVDRRYGPFDVVRWLGEEKALSVGLDGKRRSRVDGQRAVGAVVASTLHSDQQQLQLTEAQPTSHQRTCSLLIHVTIKAKKTSLLTYTEHMNGGLA